MTRVLGVDSSTQSCKALLVDTDSGEVLDEGSAAHPDGSEVNPQAWWEAFEQASASRLARADAISVAAQQHGMVALDGAGEPVRDALLWNDLRSAPQARALLRRHGREFWAAELGVVPLPSFTITKLAWLGEHEPHHAAEVRSVLLPHDWLTWQLLGRERMVTDRGDASGTGYFSVPDGQYRRELVSEALRAGAGMAPQVDLPEVLEPNQPAGHTSGGALVGPGTGDNAAAALGLGVQPGEVVVSLGTSGTVFTTSESRIGDPSGVVAGFADATGVQLPLVCTLNAARVLGATAELLGTDLAGLDELAAQAPPDASGVVLLPYLDGERTPDLPEASGSLHGLRRDTMTPAHLARAAVLGMLCGLADGVDALREEGLPVQRVLLVGGAARSDSVRSAAAEVFGVPVMVPEPREYVALGAARQAAWAHAGGAQPPAWPRRVVAEHDPRHDWGEQVRANYGRAREALYG